MVRRVFVIAVLWAAAVPAQVERPLEVRGDIQTDFQVYSPVRGDSASVPDAKTGSNSFLNFTISKDAFTAGARFENYQPALVGYDPRYKGIQIANRFARYSSDLLDVTLGNFYEQFGGGMALRSYWDWNLGYDNSFDGVRVAGAPWKGVALKGLVAVQRLYATDGTGIVRGVDGEVRVSDCFSLPAKVPSVVLGGSFVSKYQKADHPVLNLPANVAAGAGRAEIAWGIATLAAEHVHKINDPCETNGYIYKSGDATQASLSLTSPGIGLTITARRCDNMDFRSDRSATGPDLLINQIPPLTPQYTYSLAAMYPYVSQPDGELAAQVDFVCKAPAGFPLGLQGLKLWCDFSQARAIVHDPVDNPHMGYSSPPFAINDTVLYQNANLELSKKFGGSLTAILSLIAIRRNDAVLRLSDYHAMIDAYSAVLDVNYAFGDGNVIKADIEHLYTRQDRGSWAAGMVEYEFGRFFVTVRDDYNYGNPDEGGRQQYPGIGGGCTIGTVRASLTYGRTRAGIVCAGGVCRLMPSVSGLAFTLTASY